MTLAGTPFLFLAPDELTFNLEAPQVGQEDAFLVHSYIICNHLDMHVSFHTPFPMHSKSSLLHAWIVVTHC